MKKFLIIDIETVPAEKELVAAVQKNIKPDEFMPVMGHRIHTIGCCWIKITESKDIPEKLEENQFIDTAGSVRTFESEFDAFSPLTCKNEKGVLTAFIDKFKKFNDGAWVELDPSTCIVTWNGRKFDFPVIMIRCLKYLIRCPWYYQGKGTRYRFSDEGHWDIKDYMSDYGSWEKNASLDQICKLIGLPGKMELDGARVHEMVEAGKLTTIDTYCLQDVFQTALVMLRMSVLIGYSTRANFIAYEKLLVKSFLEMDLTNLDVEFHQKFVDIL